MNIPFQHSVSHARLRGDFMSSTSHMAKPNTPTCIRYVSETISGVGEITLISGNVFDVR